MKGVSKMENKYMDEFLSPYLDGMLTEEENKNIEEHLAQCPRCRKELSELKEFIELMNDMEDQELPADFHEKLHQRLLKEQESSVHKNRNQILMKWIGGLAAAVVLILSAKAFDRIEQYKLDRVRNSMDKAKIEQIQESVRSEEEEGEAKAEESAEGSGLQMAALEAPRKEREEAKEKVKDGVIKEPSASSSAPVVEQEDPAATKSSLALEAAEPVKELEAEIQEREIQEREIQEAEIQETEIQETEEQEEPEPSDSRDSGGEAGISPEDGEPAPEEEGQVRFMTALGMESIEGIYSNEVRLVVRNGDVTVDTLKEVAERAELELVQVLDDGIIVKVSGPEQREALYRELVALGELQDVGDDMESEEIRVVLFQEE